MIKDERKDVDGDQFELVGIFKIAISPFSFRMFAVHLILQRKILFNDKYKQHNAQIW